MFSAKYSADSGELEVLQEGLKMRLKWGAEPEAEIQKGPKWKPFSPDIRILWPVKEGTGANQDWKFYEYSLDNATVESFLGFRRNIPEQMALLAERFPSHQWNVVVLMQRLDRAADLAVSNPSLLWCLANCSELKEVTQKAEMWLAMCYTHRRQRVILKFLGFPENEAVVKILRKIKPEICSRFMMTMLKSSLNRDPEVLRCLGFLKEINQDILNIASNPEHFSMVTPAFLEEITSVRLTMDYPGVLSRVQDMIRRVGRRGVPRRFDSVDSLTQTHNRLMVALVENCGIPLREEAERRRRRADATGRERQPGIIPPPPLPGNEYIVPIERLSELRKEGDVQHHCVATYSRSIASGKCYVYRVLAPERATLSLIRDKSGKWTIGELKTVCNRSAKQATWDAVISWLKGARDKGQAEA